MEKPALAPRAIAPEVLVLGLRKHQLCHAERFPSHLTHRVPVISIQLPVSKACMLAFGLHNEVAERLVEIDGLGKFLISLSWNV